MLELFFGTTNAGKLRELRRLVAGVAVRVISPEDLSRPLPEVVEDGASFAANARKKAAECARATGLHALADDSGLCVDALYGLPGIRSARWSEGEPRGPGSAACSLGEVGAAELGPEMARAARDAANNDKLLRALEGVEPEIRGAEYKAVLALASPDGSILATVTGTCRGRIAEAPRGAGGFGSDPLFIPEAELERAGPGRSPRTMAEIGSEEKDAISHRGDAFRQIVPVLRDLAANL
jgi:XTP/dITP diphosphohydrolase